MIVYIVAYVSGICQLSQYTMLDLDDVLNLLWVLLGALKVNVHLMDDIQSSLLKSL